VYGNSVFLEITLSPQINIKLLLPFTKTGQFKVRIRLMLRKESGNAI
jgi:hypothetical protein